MSGTFAVSRRIWQHPEFAPSPFSEREAFLWLVSEASWKPRRVRAGDCVVDLDRGQLAASVRFIAAAWGWTPARVQRFIFRMKNADMIRVQTDTGVSVITLCNYNEYQPFAEAGDTRAIQERYRSDTNEKKEEIRKKGNTARGADRFDEFWQAYPRKVAKPTAARAWAKAIKEADPQAIIDGLQRQVPSMAGKDPQYIPHPATWLNGGRWADAPPQAQASAEPKTGDTKKTPRGDWVRYSEGIGWCPMSASEAAYYGLQ